MAERDYYEVLGVARDATADAIKKAYRDPRPQAPPGRQPGRQEGRGEVQGGPAGVRHPLRRREAVALRPLRQGRLRGDGRGRPAAGRPEWADRQGAGRASRRSTSASSSAPGRGRRGGRRGRRGRRRDLRGPPRPDARRPGRPRRRAAARARTSRRSLTIPFLTAVRGGETTIELERDGPPRVARREDPPGHRVGGQAPAPRPGRARREGGARRRPDDRRHRRAPPLFHPRRPQPPSRCRSPSARRSSAPRSTSRRSTARSR